MPQAVALRQRRPQSRERKEGDTQQGCAEPRTRPLGPTNKKYYHGRLTEHCAKNEGSPSVLSNFIYHKKLETKQKKITDRQQTRKHIRNVLAPLDCRGRRVTSTRDVMRIHYRTTVAGENLPAEGTGAAGLMSRGELIFSRVS